MPSELLRDRTGAAPYVTPFLDALDRMQERTFVRPDRLTERAEALLVERFGLAGGRSDAAFAHGSTGLLGGHTHYFDGFALLLTLPLGTAVALRSTRHDVSRLIFQGSDDTWTFDKNRKTDASAPEWVDLVIQILRHFVPRGGQVDVSVVSTVPYSCMDAYVGALGMASARASQSVFALSQDARETESLVLDAIHSCLDIPYGIAYLMAADEGRPEYFSLVDTGTLERIAIEAPPADVLGWGLVDTGTGPIGDRADHRRIGKVAVEAVSILQKNAFSNLSSLRDLEHRDLAAALEVLPRTYRPIVRHLVTENRRVQKLVGAVRRRDWQMFGALLLMSHASLQKDAKGTNQAVDLIVRETEAMSI
ncbi:MAG: hypothetical protein WD205_01185, partial [Rhodothermales bacterium]